MKQIYIWGTGCSAADLIRANGLQGRITGFIESRPGKASFLDLPVRTPQQMTETPYDLILVAANAAEEIFRLCCELKLDRERIIFTKNHNRIADLNLSYGCAEGVLKEAYLKELQSSSVIIREPYRESASAGEYLAGGEDISAGEHASAGIRNGRKRNDLQEQDYVRVKTLEMTARQLREMKIAGDAAELGVYKGRFARLINEFMPDRSLYLFDTFEGFDEEEGLKAKEASICGDAFLEAHRDTGAETVLRHMAYPEKAVIRKGLFPETAKGLEDHRFAFVSLDADLEDSTYEGLSFFVPRMSPGGVIFLHDYNSVNLSGVRAALDRYDEHYVRIHGEHIRRVHVCDVNGTLILCF